MTSQWQLALTVTGNVEVQSCYLDMIDWYSTRLFQQQDLFERKFIQYIQYAITLVSRWCSQTALWTSVPPYVSLALKNCTM